MCLIIDTCSFADVFNSSTENHNIFKPVLLWVTKGKGKIIYGGTKYKNEMKLMPKYFSILVELSKQGRVVILDDVVVDRAENKVREIEPNPDFDDPHLVALVIVSRSRIVCTNDKRAHKFLKRRELYPKGVYKPRIYSNEKHTDLLSDENIIGVCK